MLYIVNFIQVGQRAVMDKRSQQSAEPEKWEAAIQNAPSPPADVVVSFDGFDVTNPKQQLDFLGPTASTILTWLNELLSTPDGTLVWVTGHHLLTDFQLCTGQLGVWRNSVTKHWEPYNDCMVGTQYDFQQAAKQFSNFLRVIGRVFGVATKCYSQRPSGTSFRRWTKCMFLRMPLERIVQIDRIWFQFHVAPVDFISSSFKEYPGAVSLFTST